jgi:hypothetical protein
VDGDLEGLIDELYAAPLDRFTPGRDALAKRLRSEGDAAGAERVRALRKPVVSAWALNALAREDPEGVAELEELGRRLRDAERQAVSGGDAGPLRDALEERRALVSRLAAGTMAILQREGAGSASTQEDVTSTLEAAAVDETAVAALRTARLSRPMRPPSGFGDAPALSVVPGARRSAAREEPPAPPADLERRSHDLRRELSAAETRQRRADEAVERARTRLEEAERRRSEAKDRLREAEAEQRGAVLNVKRLAAELSKLERRP